jgi:DNA repair protein RecN (Recombination protein N)
MLKHLSIKNYALINQLETDFTNGLTTITGETGSGKSILLGALGLILGKRADLGVLKNKEQKCIIEANFDLSHFKIKTFFNKNDLDYEQETFIRREILPSGKSRAFINDTPVTLAILSKLGTQLIDIHSQHQTLAVSSKEFQFELLDSLAKNEKYLESYKRGLSKLKTAQKELTALKEAQEQAKAMYDYNLHLYQELKQAELQEDEQESLEERLRFLENIDGIKVALSDSYNLINVEEIGLQQQLFTLKSKFQHLNSLSNKYEIISNRIESLNIDFLDIASEVELALEQVEFDPSELDKITSRLQLIYDLQAKHQVATIVLLLEKQQELQNAVAVVEDSASLGAEKEQIVQEISSKLDELSLTIHDRRKAIIPKLDKQLKLILKQLGMHNAQFQIEVSLVKDYFSNGKDDLIFLFSANKGNDFGELKKVASGGELSRIMLAIKTVLSKHKKLPTIIFDEIDTGVSGEVANQMALIMKAMSANMQVVSITHLPQIAAQGDAQLEVYKFDINEQTETAIKQLSQEERVNIIAGMISGKNITAIALQHAKELLQIA